ncbi:MAG: protein translocase subunit SecD [Chlamydiales bacterium]|nr:protein translocase subunit SecD [Chlamydiales bacterium]
MEKVKRWHSYLILGVVLITLYNIFPTILYYSKPLSSQIEESQAKKIAYSAMQRVDNLEQDAIKWVESFASLIHSNVKSVSINQKQPHLITIKCKSIEDANKFRQLLPKAGALIPFFPSQLTLANSTYDIDTTTVIVYRNIPIHFATPNFDSLFTFGKLYESDGSITKDYRLLIDDKLKALGVAIGGSSENTLLVKLILENKTFAQSESFLYVLSQNLLHCCDIFPENSEAATRYFSSFTQGFFQNKPEAIQHLIERFQQLKDEVKLEKITLKNQETELQKTGQYLSATDTQKLALLTQREEKVFKTIQLLKNNQSKFIAGAKPFQYNTISTMFEQSDKLFVGKNNFLISSLLVDTSNNKIFIKLHKDIELALADPAKKEKVEQFIFNELARVSKEINEKINFGKDGYELSLTSLENAKSFIALNLPAISEQYSNQLIQLLSNYWNPEFKDLNHDLYPILGWNAFYHQPVESQNLSLVVYTPTAKETTLSTGFNVGSAYVIAKDLGAIVSKFQQAEHSPQARQFFRDFDNLKQLLVDQGFVFYPGNTFPFAKEFENDLIFELKDFYMPLIKATRENFKIAGTKQFALLEFSDLKQRLMIDNHIDTSIHEDLLKWKDEYLSSKVDPTLQSKFDVPAPTTNTLWNNFLLSAKKYFRGDEKKVLQWGLDLSGGKTVQIELRDQNNIKVINDLDIRQGINELYQRVNKMGVSEVAIRQEGSNITLDFPGAQALSASELVKASSMSFHVVNEQFSLFNKSIAEHVNRFLQDVWSEAVVTSKTSQEDLNLIAWNHLYGDATNPERMQPRSESAKILYEYGLRLMHPFLDEINSSFDDSVSKIAVLRGDSPGNWLGQAHPLLIVFKNYALEGSSLENVRSNYDPSKGNFLSFEVKSGVILGSGERLFPRQDLSSWTSKFAKDNILGTAHEKFTSGRGWRMAVILNGFVVSAPSLESTLKDSAVITGQFTQREVQKLESDLKAGSLTFTPYILSEKNISPDLGLKERTQGIVATIIALIAVIATMVGYYRFAGIIASIAVLFNLLITWAALQAFGSTLTLSGIAGVILAVGMAVDANVLVFERIREELSRGVKLAPAITAGYRKAFSAIFDSNITTIIAAFILLCFDAGPVKGLALTLIIGISSSMFTALFMTKFVFDKWLEKTTSSHLNMMHLINPTNIPFLKYIKLFAFCSIIIAIAGSFSIYSHRNSIVGMDFSGGNATTMELHQQGKEPLRQKVEQALIASHANPQYFQVREISGTNQVRIFLSKNMEDKNQPFYQLPKEATTDVSSFRFEKNPRLQWIVQAMQQSGLDLTEKSKESLDQSWTSISGQMSDAMRNNALMGLGIALLCILIYITFRFEFKYAISATLGLAFDVVITLSILGILHALSIPVQIDMNTIAALMTIVGYSLNDTIIVFDRIREDAKNMKRYSFSEIVNYALNVTLSRTFMTSFTTLIVLLVLVAFGGSTIFGFSLMMAIGVVIGTLSTLFVSSGLLLFFEHQEQKRAISATNNV